jgi:CDK-activating kinase assembly factor MAT1
MDQFSVPFTCFICFEAAFTSLNNRVLTSRLCGHKVCSNCLKLQEKSKPTICEFNAKVAHIKENDNIIKCPICCYETKFTDWIDRETTDTQFEQYKAVSQRVSAVYNLTRQYFNNTPAYNDYLEKKEEIICELLNNPNEKERKRIQTELNNYEAENQKQIIECQQVLKKMECDWIRDIVEKEGIFYEKVKLDFENGFKTRSTNLVHSLQRRFSDLFVTEESSNLLASGNEHRLKENNNTPIVLGVGNQPKPLIPNLNYAKIPKNIPTDIPAMRRASGMLKKSINLRVLQETWGGLYVKVKKIKF